MVGADLEINRLRWALSNSGWESHELDEICDLAQNDINSAIIDIVTDAVAQVTEYATELGAEEFINEMTVLETGNSYVIASLSGTTDYSTPEVKMLPSLLKNAEVAKDGTRYKVIPIPKRDGTPKIATSFFDLAKERQSDINDARTALKQRSQDRSERATAMADQFRQSLGRSLGEKKNNKQQQQSAAGVEFRTATDKQDANTQWVLPEKDLDMTQYLMGINDQIGSAIDASVGDIIAHYEQEYA